MNIIEPIDPETQQRVIEEVYRYIQLASVIYNDSFADVDVVFNLRGRAAGIYRTYYPKRQGEEKKQMFRWFSKPQQQIRFNPWLFAKYPADSWDNTIPHEVAHYISDCLYGLNNIKPHGNEWRAIMQAFGAKPVVRGDYSLEGIPTRRVQRYRYQCECRDVELTTYRHKNIQRGIHEYRCRDCSGLLEYVG